MPVATHGSVKGLTPVEIRATGAEMILSNAYHLWLRPGCDVIETAGGLHRFMGWDGPILTDSGGYQIFSLAALARVTDEGVTFRSHIDGSAHALTPEDVIRTQERLGSDVAMILDECPPGDADRATIVAAAAERTAQWAERAVAARTPRRSGGLRHRPGRHAPRPPPRERTRHGRPRVRRLRARRPLGR